LLGASRYGRPQPELSPQQMRALMAHDWAGNVRELRNVADCLVLGVRANVPGMDAPAPMGAAPAPAAAGDEGGLSLAESVEGYERSLIRAELQRQGGNIARSAKALRIPKTTLNDKIRKYGLQGEE
jgi:two-component system C4-dicarboxylate transport response regulator DctD